MVFNIASEEFAQLETWGCEEISRLLTEDCTVKAMKSRRDFSLVKCIAKKSLRTTLSLGARL